MLRLLLPMMTVLSFSSARTCCNPDGDDGVYCDHDNSEVDVGTASDVSCDVVHVHGLMAMVLREDDVEAHDA